MLKIKVISAHPEMFPGTLGYSIIGKALKEKKFKLSIDEFISITYNFSS